MLLRLCILITLALTLALPGSSALSGQTSCPSQQALDYCPTDPALLGPKPLTRAELPCDGKIILAQPGETCPARASSLHLTNPTETPALAGLVPGGIDRPPKRPAA